MKSRHNQIDALRRISDGSAEARGTTEPRLRHAENIPLAPAIAAAMMMVIMMVPAAFAITAVLDTGAPRDTPESGEEQFTTTENVAASMAIFASYFFAGFFLVSIRDSENMADATSFASLTLLLSLIGTILSMPRLARSMQPPDEIGQQIIFGVIDFFAPCIAIVCAGGIYLRLRGRESRESSTISLPGGNEVRVWSARQFKWQALFWRLAALLLCGGGIAGFAEAVALGFEPDGAAALQMAGLSPTLVAGAGLVLLVCVLMFAHVFVGLARKKVPPSALPLVESSRPLVLYLRSFEHDGQRMRIDEDSFKVGCLAILSGGLNLFARGLAFLAMKTVEQRVVQALSRSGNCIAIGRPDESMAEDGAKRIYVEDEHWRDVVEYLVHRCHCVVIHPGFSSGIVWELETIARQLSPERVLVIQNRFKSQSDYTGFSRMISAGLPTVLPDGFERSSVFFFQSGDSSDCDTEQNPKWRAVGLDHPRGIPYDHSLAPELRRLLVVRGLHRTRAIRRWWWRMCKWVGQAVYAASISFCTFACG